MPDTPQGDSPSPIWTALAEIKAALAGIQATANFVKDEQGAVRQRLHDLSGQFQSLMGLPDQMREMKVEHAELRKKLDSIIPVVERVPTVTARLEKLEPVVDGLTRDRAVARGAMWAIGIISGLLGAALGVGIKIVQHP